MSNLIAKQVEFYFSDSNFRRDRFLQAETAKHPERFIPFSVLFTFKKLQALTTDPAELASAIETSKVVELNAERNALRRVVAELPVDTSAERTIVFVGLGTLPPTHEEIAAAFPADVVTFSRVCKMAGRFFGCVHVEFKDDETTNAILSGPAIVIKGLATQKMRLAEFLKLPMDDRRDFEKGIQVMIRSTNVPDDVSFHELMAAIEGLWADDRHKKPLVSLLEAKNELQLLYSQPAYATEAVEYLAAHPVVLKDVTLVFEHVTDAEAVAARTRKESKKRSRDESDGPRQYVCISNIGKGVKFGDIKDMLIAAVGEGNRPPYVEYANGSTIAKINFTDMTSSHRILAQLQALENPLLGGKTPVFALVNVGEEPPVEVDYEKGLIVKLTGVPSTVSRDVIKATLNDQMDAAGVVAYIQFQLGQTEALLRVDTPVAAAKVVSLVSHGVVVGDKEEKLGGAVILEGDEEHAFWLEAETARRARLSQSDSNKFQRSDGGRGGRGGRGRGRGRGGRR
ncbi:hypothetical protein SPRG_05603 [Saprolegnia parasitica CBS 223.65]|uniref:Uncharacterized protein n=1 Tax=Saprolegnia parasitica (strain CBS 223.65) TaxID=695850 RepID=A0A067CT10_SAPPC|nr:hypothetical protein SPRG_05603 [Saprolegnia parasitica CBS 223.65]KDO29651.1 hypothetical protein SPRG_05603 [Saprolegnia parasitica CBS 223.65]|eukprot:XP_012199710.1 hypothetical protein SPRG_05603 [Saprolegnia parasitica CBS 223.65]